ncbi:hypothetical protein DIE19_35740 [Burkholderia sp. Bp9126]|nr:hypothetical protein DIE19_35740 [Burkholderia sp. Bp9126]
MSRLTLRGRADLAAEKTVMLKRFKDSVAGASLIEPVDHSYGARSWITVVTLNGGKAKVGHCKPSKSINLMISVRTDTVLEEHKKCHPGGVA